MSLQAKPRFSVPNPPEMSKVSLRTLLCLMDGSEPSCRAARVAANLARASKSRLIFASFARWEKMPREIQRYLEGDGHEGEGLRELAFVSDEAQSCLDAAQAIAAEAGLEHFEKRVVADTSRYRFRNLIRDVRADCVVVGGRRQNALMDVILGSIPRSVLRQADIPVLCVS